MYTGEAPIQADTFSYDLAGNRIREQIDTPNIAPNTPGDVTSTNETIDYTFSPDDQLTRETATLTTTVHLSGGGTTTNTTTDYTTIYAYAPNGSLVSQIRTGNGAVSDSYTYDLRGRMITSTAGNATTTYTYDTDGVLATQTNPPPAAGQLATTNTYLNDPNNPTGYTKAIETTATTGPISTTTSYILGLKVEGQSDTTNGTLYLITDGHGSTRALVNMGSAVVETEDYNAFGTALDFNATTSKTVWLFGGDGFYDPASGWTYHLARWRNGFWFTQEDTIDVRPGDLVDANLYLYVGGDPLNGWDPSGHLGLGGTLVVAGISAILWSLILPNTANAPSLHDKTYGDSGGDLYFGLAVDLASPFFVAYLATPALKAVAPGLKQVIGVARSQLIVRFLAQGEGAKVLDPVELNARWLGKPGGYAVWDNLSTVAEFQTAEAGQYVRVFAKGAKPYGSFLARAQDIQGLTPQQIKNVLALKDVPAYIQKVNVPAGTTIRVGVTATNQYGAGGMFQVELVDHIPNSAFGPPSPLK